MWQKSDFTFQSMLERAREENLNSRDVEALNRRLVIELPISNTLDIVIVVQKNKSCLVINQLQITKFVRENNQDIIIFPGKHYQTRKDDKNLI